MKILFFHRWVGSRLGGTESRVKKIAQALSERGHDIEVLTVKGDKLADLNFINEVHFLGPSPLESFDSYPMRDPRVYLYTFLFFLKAALYLMRLRFIQNKCYDLVSVHFFTEALIIRILRPLLGWPYLFSLEGYTHLEAREAKFADASICVSNTVRRRCYENFKYLPVVIPIGIDVNRFCPSGNKIDLHGRKMVLSLGRLAPEKEIGVLIDAAYLVCQKADDIIFMIAGDGLEKDRLQAQARVYNLGQRVLFTGGLKNEEIASYYRSADIFAVTQYPPDQVLITIAEAMACGAPVIAVSPLAELEILGDAGIILPPREPGVLADAILKLIYDPLLRDSLKERGIQRARDNYDWSKTAERCALVYERAGDFKARKDAI